MNRKKQLVIVVILIAAVGIGVRALFHYGGLRWQQREQPSSPGTAENHLNSYSWAAAVAKVKEERREAAVALETPPELRHYSDRHWFLATQIAEITKYNVRTCQDFVDLAAMIQGGELVGVPAVTNTYVLYGVGEKADDEAFSRYQDEHSIHLYDEAQLNGAYKLLSDKHSNLQKEISTLNAQSRALPKRERTKQSELQKQITSRQQELNSTEEEKALLDQFYGKPESRQRLLRDYSSLQTLGQNFAGRSFDLDKASDRQALKVSMLSSLRPEALKILEEVALAYQRQFDRPLPVSSLVRPEQYQHALRRVNRNAVLIETPPHSTGLAFDIDYRYMSAAEQNFVMAELARLEIAGRIEVIRERNANYHVFAFLNGLRPSDELITASLDVASVEVQQAHHAAKQPLQVNGKRPRAVKAKQKARSRRR
ncbi:MAG: DUF5715 family protein [Pyrinomonadaceae bacterium]